MKKIVFVILLLIPYLLYGIWSKEIKVSPNEGCYNGSAASILTQGPGKCAVSSGDEVYIVWSDQYYQDYRYNIFFYDVRYYRPLDTLENLDTYYPAGIGGLIQEWNPVIAAGEDGTKMILWEDNRTINILIRSRYYNGFAWDTIKVVDYQTGVKQQWFPDIVWNNGYHAVYETVDEFNLYISYSYFENNIGLWTDPVILSDTTHASVYPSIASSGENIMVSWYDLDKNKIYFSIYDGTSWNGPNEFPFDGQYPFIEGDGSGGFFIVYENKSVTGISRIYFSHYIDGEWTQIYPISNGYYNSYYPKAVYKNGFLYVVWMCDYLTSGSNVFYRIFDVVDNIWESEESIVFSPQRVYRPTVTVDAYNNVYVFWADYRTEWEDYSPDIYCKVDYNVSGKQIYHPAQINVRSVRDEIFINSSIKGYVYLFDITGRLKWKGTIGNDGVISINTQKINLPNGVYIVSLRSPDTNEYVSKKVSVYR